MKALILLLVLGLVGCETPTETSSKKEAKPVEQKDSSSDRDQGKGNDDKEPKDSKKPKATDPVVSLTATESIQAPEITYITPTSTPTLTAAQNACNWYHADLNGKTSNDSGRSEYRCEYADQINNTTQVDYAFYADGTGYINNHYEPFRRFEWLIDTDSCRLRLKINGTWTLELQSPYLNSSGELELAQQLTISVNAKEALRCAIYLSPRN